VATRQPTNIVDLLAILLAPFNELETAFNDLLLNRTIDLAVGDALAVIGRIVGQPAIGDAIGDDDVYRKYIKARAAANRSDGTGEDLIAVCALVLDGTGANVRLYREGPATQIVEIDDVAITETVATVLLYFLQAACSAGARVLLRYALSPPASVFRFDSGPGYDVGHLAAGVDAG
jgi:hypothetical protein